MPAQSFEAMLSFNVPKLDKCVFGRADNTVLSINEEDTCDNALVATKPGYTGLGNHIPENYFSVL